MKVARRLVLSTLLLTLGAAAMFLPEDYELGVDDVLGAQPLNQLLFFQEAAFPPPDPGITDDDWYLDDQMWVELRTEGVDLSRTTPEFEAWLDD